MRELGLNAVVIDVKDMSGFVTYATEVPLARELGTIRRRGG